MKTEFAGFRMESSAARDETWEHIARNLAERGQVAYRVVRVVPPPPPRPAAAASPPEGESRAQVRRKTRLRSAKVLDEANRFLCEAVVQNRSAEGFRLLLARNVALPARGYRGSRQTSRQKNTTTNGSSTAGKGRNGGKLLLKPRIGPIVNAP